MTTATFPERVWQLPVSLNEDLAKFQTTTEQFKSGKISATEYQVFRVPQGVYEQRENGSFMLRVRLPAGIVLPHQMRVLADAAEQFGNGVLHLTTRQDVQVHQVPVDSIHPALVQLAGAGLSTKGGGGNTVRNITGCTKAGVCPNEAFDVTPHAIALTEFMLNDPNSFKMPRKYKIAFSGCGKDCAGATVNDLGLIAKIRDGVEGFAIYVGGGLGSNSRVADLLEEFVPVSEAGLVAEAVKRVFYQHGNRKDKRQARLRYLIRQLGNEKFVALYREELEAVRKEQLQWPAPRALSLPDSAPSTSTAAPDDAGYNGWIASNVKAQKQSGYRIIEIPLLLGDISADKLRSLASIVEAYGEKSLRATPWQNFVLRWVPENKLGELYRALEPLELTAAQPAVLKNLVSCTGASTCKLGICLARGLSKGIADKLQKSDIDLNALGDVSIQISGCPNSCGRHPIAAIGLHGAARRMDGSVDGQMVPHYKIQLGGHVEEGSTQLATGKNFIPARNVPAFAAELLKAYEKYPAKPDFRGFLRDGGNKVVEELVAKYKPVPSFEEDKNFYYDWGANKPFSLAGRGPGECGAGVFDLIEVDLKSANDALAEASYFKAAALAARALLVTRGEQAQNNAESFVLFQKHFVEASLADARYTPLLENGARAAEALPPGTGFTASPEEVSEFVGSIQSLFAQMDASLQFPKRQEQKAAPQPEPQTEQPSFDLEKDFRGIVCPLNYVKTKMALGLLKSGQTLSVLLDENGARNVPESAAKDGHEIRSVTQNGGTWQVVIRKA